MSNLLSLTSAQLIRAAGIKDKIEALNKELNGILGSSVTAKTTAPKAKRKMSAAAKAKIAAAQKARWAKVKTVKPVAKVAAKPAVKKSKISAAGRARIAAAAKARWAKVKAAGKTKL
jgi:hypothetical protein